NIAWHAGGSIMPAPDNRRNVNRFSIGIENVATASSGFTDAQYRALSALITDIKHRHSIKHIVGHDQIGGERAVGMGLRRDVKPDPGPRFDWARLHQLLGEEG
ncbi:MAG TPA: N-acetylmuramoyl-L-alanine amidase, partial [Armatimonadota bacterium]